MTGNYVIAIAFCCAVGPALLCLWNMLLYREPGAVSGFAATGNCELPDCISVLIPARNEERVIAASLESVLASRGVGF
jgi:cellulose synthase/poly-beta-1,6-N-acetylglucosamine synthase-like glycosyltransferase